MPEESWLLMPGDMLYLPPGVAHHGVAFGECMTFSIGFRAPSESEMLADFGGLVMQGARDDVHYADPDLLPVTNAGELTSEARARARQMLRKQLRPSDEALDIWFGCLMTEPKPWLRPVPPARRCTPTTLKSCLKAGRSLRWHPAARVAWFGCAMLPTCSWTVCIIRITERLAAFARLLGESPGRWRLSAPARHIANPAAASLLLEWLDAGQWSGSR